MTQNGRIRVNLTLTQLTHGKLKALCSLRGCTLQEGLSKLVGEMVRDAPELARRAVAPTHVEEPFVFDPDELYRECLRDGMTPAVARERVKFSCVSYDYGDWEPEGYLPDEDAAVEEPIDEDEYTAEDMEARNQLEGELFLFQGNNKARRLMKEPPLTFAQHQADRLAREARYAAKKDGDE